MPLDGTPYLDDTGKEILEALDLLRKEGWCRGMQYDPYTGNRCALGAIFSVNTTDIRSMKQDFSRPSVLRLADATGVERKEFHLTPVHIAAHIVAEYNNTQTDFAKIEEWFERAAFMTDQLVTIA